MPKTPKTPATPGEAGPVESGAVTLRTVQMIVTKAKIRSALKGDAAGPAKTRRVDLVLTAPASHINGAVLDRLYEVVLSRRTADPAVSHSARLLSRGPAKVAQKFGEEAVECLIEAVGGNRDAVVGESADVLYHLIVLWVSAGVRPEDVWAELTRREGVSGIAERAARGAEQPLALRMDTSKIP